MGAPPPYRDDLASLTAHAERLAAENARLRVELEDARVLRRRGRAERLRAIVTFAGGRYVVGVVLTTALLGGVVFLFIRQFDAGRTFTAVSRDRARISLLSLYPVATSYRLSHPGTCPTLDGLEAEHQLRPGTSLVDPWGTPFAIACSGSDTMTSSAGPDRRFGTADDLVVPAASTDR